MNFNATAKDLRDQSYKTIDQGKGLLDGLTQDAYQTAKKLSKRWKQSYPKISRELKEHANVLQQRAGVMQDQAGDRFGEWKKILSSKTHELGATSLKVKSCLLKVGMIYVLYRLFNSNEVAQAADKVKARIEAKPVESAAIALGIGYLIARVLR